MANDRDSVYVRLEQLGPAAVRAGLQSDTFSTSWRFHILEWLAEKDHEEQRLAASSLAEQMEIARRDAAAAERAASAAERAATAADRAATAAEMQAAEARRANTRATIALAIAIISIIVSAIGIWLPLWSAHK